jgi:hypothetical protein
MTATSVDFNPPQLSNVTLENNIYHTPTTANNPLFDSFAIDFDRRKNTFVISLFQMTTSETHGGLAKGYPNIRKIMARVRKLLEEKDSNAAVKVRYFLVCPDDGSQRKWQMPDGWNENTDTNDHRGDVFCIYIPIKARLNRGLI